MAVAETGLEPVARRKAVDWRRVRYVLLAGVVVLLVTALGFGTLSASMADLDAAIAAGRVHEVTVVGALPTDGTVGGYGRVEVHWQDRFLRRTAELEQVVGEGMDPPPPSSGLERVVGDVVPRIQRNGPVAVTSSAATGRYGWRVEVLGLAVPGWIGPLGLLLGLGTLALLIGGPDPWWATRWAWFWFIASPLGAVAIPVFLLVSGPPPGVTPGTGPGRRLGGIWAFFLAGGLVTLFGLRG